MSAMSIAKSERFFRVAAGLDVDKSDLKRYSDFVNQKIYDLLLRGQATAQANGRDIIEPFDVPITKGLQERIHDFRNIDEEIELKPILDYMFTCASSTRAPNGSHDREKRRHENTTIS
jgi:uncharacterized protein DUF1931